MYRRYSLLISLLVISLVNVAVNPTQAQAPEAAPETPAEPDGISREEVNYEGLSRLRRGPFHESWADLQVDYTRYDKVILVDPVFEFRAVNRSSPASVRASNRREYYISDQNRERLVTEVAKVYQEELAASRHFKIVDTPGPDVAVLVVGVLDIVSRVPPQLLGRNEIYLSSVGEGTLVVELKDSLSSETIFRGIERRAAQHPTGYVRPGNAVTNWTEVRRLARRWAIKMREGLDAIHAE